MRLIDADVLLERIEHRNDYIGGWSDPVYLVKDAPTIEAEPMKWGRWNVICSACNKISRDKFNYCPNCGAKMVNP